MYTIEQDYYVQEFDIQLYAGGTVQDGDLEPDVVAQLVSQSVLLPEGQAVIEAEEVSAEAEAEEKPKRSL